MNEQAHITNAIPLLPNCGERDRVTEILIDEFPDEGARAMFENIQTVRDVRRIGVAGLVECGMSEPDAAWLVAQFGGAKRGRKPKAESDG